MINIRFDKEITEITAQGHSGYEESGKDIVCASITTAFIMTSSMLKNLHVKHSYGCDPKVPFMGIKLNGSIYKNARVIIDSLIEVCRLIMDEYPEYVSVECVDINTGKA